MDRLPVELLLYTAQFLEPVDIARLQGVSRKLFKLARDNHLWRTLCFENSHSDALLQLHRELAARRENPAPTQDGPVDSLQRAAGTHTLNRPPDTEQGAHTQLTDDKAVDYGVSNVRKRALAHWDPSYPGERVHWYHEYVTRHAPLSMSWVQQPNACGREYGGQKRELRGIALFEPLSGGVGRKIVAPLDDGSVCLWDISREKGSPFGREGSIVGRSKVGLLTDPDQKNGISHDATSVRTQMTSTGAVETVSVDNFRNTAYFAVQSCLTEVDLETLQIIGQERYPFSISALSEATYPLPLTVGTTLSLHLHDPRLRNNARSPNNDSEFLDQIATFPAAPHSSNTFHRLFSGDSPLSTPAPLFQPGPLSILHLDPLAADGGTTRHSGDIFVAGRFPSILHYDRRFFPRLRRTIHSGARLCSLTSVPCASARRPFQPAPSEQTPAGSSLINAAQDIRPSPSAGGETALIACGEYNGKGSLELYSLQHPSSPSPAPPPDAGLTLSRTFHNRVSASRSKLLSVTTHGTTIVFSDGDGMLKFVERDAATLVRRWNINEHRHRFRPLAELDVGGGGLWSTSVLEPGPAGGGDVARKIVSTSRGGEYRADDDLLVWTGERVGVVRFGSGMVGFGADEFEDADDGDGAERVRRREERIYGQTLRRELERQADEVRFVRGLGAGLGSSGG